MVKNALVDPDPSFPIFYFPKFHLFRPPSRRFAPFVVQNALFDLTLTFLIFYFHYFIFFRQWPSLRRAANDIPWLEAGGAAGGDDGGCHNHDGGRERRDDVMPN